MTGLEKFRFRLSDQLKTNEVVYTGDGIVTSFSLAKVGVNSSEVWLNGVLQTTGYTIDNVSGTIFFTVAPAYQVVVRVRFEYAAFTDVEANALMAEYGLDQALVEAIDVLLLDSAKLSNYKAGDSSIDNTTIFAKLKEMRSILKLKSNATIIAERVVTDYPFTPTTTEVIDLTRDDSIN